jgi:predicted nucleic acid-binding Zn ribbon protein
MITNERMSDETLERLSVGHLVMLMDVGAATEGETEDWYYMLYGEYPPASCRVCGATCDAGNVCSAACYEMEKYTDRARAEEAHYGIR